MNEPEGRVDALERWVARVLRLGVSGSCLLLAVGTIVTLVDAGTRAHAARTWPRLRQGALEPSGDLRYHSIGAALGGLTHWPGPALVTLGILLLIATPVVRVAVSILGYALDGDRRYVVITAVVLAVLLGSFAIG